MKKKKVIVRRSREGSEDCIQFYFFKSCFIYFSIFDVRQFPFRGMEKKPKKHFSKMHNNYFFQNYFFQNSVKVPMCNVNIH